LALLVPRIGADHTDHAFALDDLAVAADFLDGSEYFHDDLGYVSLLIIVVRYEFIWRGM
jgi:hypothetical protein